ncbi:MAG: probable oxidoreductase/Short-chain dehydrogenase [uncultured Cytophagales bacterium]|uniref:Probable oxidoreductase/Short-chain dehydrogenase n=1 Tax=uncultured Cytophagales bacterium TaxID=158755 RepID=A0A6J4IFY3_9SPHI|nr:MAG: probable oxidoreductase/Short-chain dehydrogenase [uncultured Cytophagales bacterium]
MDKWNIDQVPSQSGRVAIVTGANGGLGYETALQLAKKDVRVILACRNVPKAEKAKARIVSQYPEAQVRSMPLDVSSLREVREFAAQFGRQYDRLDLLINNAGIMMSPYQVTEDGFENQLATNYIGHFALTGLLLPSLARTPGSRVVTLSSLSYKWARIQFEDLHARQGYSRRKAYGQSKRACLMFAYELHRRLSAAGYGTLSVAAHPGLAKTNLDQYFPALIRPLGSLFLQPARKGALPVLYAALAQDVKGGEFIGPDGFGEMRGDPARVDSDEYSKDANVARQLWQASEAMTGVYYPDGKG